MNKSFQISREKLEKMLRDYRQARTAGAAEPSDIQKLRRKVSDKELLNSIDDSIIETYLRSKKIKKNKK